LLIPKKNWMPLNKRNHSKEDGEGTIVSTRWMESRLERERQRPWWGPLALIVLVFQTA